MTHVYPPSPSLVAAPLDEPRFSVLTPLALWLIALKPLIDVQEPFGTGTDLGALLSLTVGGLCLWEFLRMGRRMSRVAALTIACVMAVAAISLLHAMGSRGSGRKQVLLELSRFLASFGPLLLLMLLARRPRFLEIKRFKRLSLTLLLCSLPHFALAISQTLGFSQPYYRQWNPVTRVDEARPSGFFMHPIALGQLCVGLLVLTYLMAPWFTRRFSVKYGVIGLLLLMVIATTHRTSMIAAVAVVGFMELMAIVRQRGRVSLGKGTLMVVGLVVFAVAFQWLILDRLSSLLDMAYAFDPTDRKFLRGRLQVWSEVFAIYGSWPFPKQLIGQGHSPLSYSTHNNFLHVLTVWGALGVGLFLTMLTAALHMVWVRTRSTGRDALLAAALYTLLFAMVTEPLTFPLFLWVVLLIALCAMTVYPRDRAWLEGHQHATRPGVNAPRAPAGTA